MNNFNRFLVIVFFTAFSLLIALPKNVSILGQNFNRNDINFKLGKIEFNRDLELKLGLDLKGGTHLVFDIDTTNLKDAEKQAALSSLKEIVSRRVNLFGVSEPEIRLAQFEGRNNLIVDMPGVEDVQEAVALVGKTAELQFIELEEIPPTEEELLEDASASGQVIPKVTDLGGADVKKASVVFDGVSAKPAVSIEFTDEGAKKFEEITERNVGNVLPIILDDQIISSPLVQDKIIGGSAQISGEFTVDEADNLAIQINGGALPAPMALIAQENVGPTLGQESIDKSIFAGLVGLGIVVAFMIIMYGFLGFVADIGLVLFGIYTIALYKLIPVVLTLPGIAGFLLSVGMAVDANILIFERFREERAKGASREYALESGFGRAWDSIRDANIATLVTAFVLANPFNWNFLHTSGPVRGFAITLALGILVSLFTGVVVSRTLLRMTIKNKDEN